MPNNDKAKTIRGVETRARILETALRLFREHGYDATTMRRIADEAGVSVGNAYYYFRSKEMLVQAFYMRTHEEHLEACARVLPRQRSFEGRLRAAMRVKLETIEPYHPFAGVLFRTAADPSSPLNPFSDESLPTRTEATALFARIVADSKIKATNDLGRELPYLLWLYHMGVIVFWIHDNSPERAKSYRLVEATVPLIARIVTLARLPGLRSFASRAIAFVREMREDRGLAPG